MKIGKMADVSLKLFLLLFLVGAVAAGCSSAPRYRSYPSGDEDLGRQILDSAESQMGVDYHYGGTSPDTGFDCSGLAWWSHSVNGIDIPRESDSQYYSKKGKKISKSNLMPGDLVYFETYRKGPSHVGIYTGKGSFVHSPNSNKSVQEDEMTNSYYKKRYLGARRFW